MKIVSFDIESNGLHGQAFAVGGVVYDSTMGTVLDTLTLRCPIRGMIDSWVLDNVLPYIGEIKDTHKRERPMRAAFWQWLQANKQDAIVLVDVGYPVEARFLTKCQDDDKSRAWEAPYPLHELASILLQYGVNPDIDRVQMAGKEYADLSKHNPIWDALRAAVIAGRLLPEGYAMTEKPNNGY